MSSNGAHQVKAPLTSEELKLPAWWTTTFAFPLAVQPVAIGELDIEYRKTSGRAGASVGDLLGVLTGRRMSKPRVQVRGKILQISFSYLHVREVLKVQVEADSLEKTKVRDIANED